MSQFPATKIVHWPSGPVKACDRHTSELERLAGILGAHIGVSDLTEPGECGNCINEAAAIAAVENADG